MKSIRRRSSHVVSIHVELMTSVNERLEEYCKSFGRSKRFIIEDAITCWINQRDLETNKQDVSN